ncbi:hypothetical protein M3Y97_01076800 [Aphelenchoides bicaudatus]|nr:hypothetical protein M3Y97_01076800 [Aphelenchoides bicaudatus]
MAHAPKSECCCSISVHTGAKIAAWISIICSILMGVLRFPLGLIGTLINAIICGMLIYGVRNPTSQLLFAIPNLGCCQRYLPICFIWVSNSPTYLLI